MKTFKKSTPEEVKEMGKLYKEGWSINAISEKFEKDRKTIWYWLKKKFKKLPQRKNKRISFDQSTSKNAEETLKRIRAEAGYNRTPDYDKLLAERRKKDPAYY